MTREHYDSLLRELDNQVVAMGELVADTIAVCIQALQDRDVETAQRIIAGDSRIDENRYDIENQVLVAIATQQPLAKDLRILVAALTVATELERIGDYCEGIAKLALRMAAEPVNPQITSIRGMAGETRRLLLRALHAYRERDTELAGEVWTRDDTIDDLYEEVFRHLVAEMAMDPMTVRDGTYLLWAAHNVERMADRVTNIAERVAFMATGDIAAFRDRLRAQSLPG